MHRDIMLGQGRDPCFLYLHCSSLSYLVIVHQGNEQTVFLEEVTKNDHLIKSYLFYFNVIIVKFIGVKNLHASQLGLGNQNFHVSSGLNNYFMNCSLNKWTEHNVRIAVKNTIL